ncbi:MAG: molybdenum ABC transporter ATP-binding protein [Hyphomicrobiales bacterium]|nr:molybdenum ABC transporter ATP-binding protein [Hyphomicrobiales bacterium]
MSLDVLIAHAFGQAALDVCFTAPGGGVTALFGPSGAGKSTVVAAIAGLFAPRVARIALNGAVLTDTATGVFVAPRRRRVGCVFQDGRLFNHLSVEGNLLYGWRRTGRRASAGDIEALLRLLGLSGMLDRRPASLSGGERQRVALGRALLADPALLLLDEPLAALDDARKAEILPYLERVRDESLVPMVYVSHSAAEVSRLADHVVVLRDGRVAAQGRAAEVLSDGPTTRKSSREALRGTVLSVCERGARIAIADAEAWMRGDGLATGEMVFVTVRPADVVLSLAPVVSSAPLTLRARIAEVQDDRNGAVATLDCPAGRFEAQLGWGAAERLALAPGAEVYAAVTAFACVRPESEEW